MVSNPYMIQIFGFCTYGRLLGQSEAFGVLWLQIISITLARDGVLSQNAIR